MRGTLNRHFLGVAMSRRLFFCLMALAAMLCPVQVAMTADGQPLVSDSDVRVERSGGNFTVDLTMYAPVAPSLAWADRKSTRLNSSHIQKNRMPSSA